MAEDRKRVGSGPDARPIDEPIAGTAPAIPDEARGKDQPLPDEPTEEEVERAADALDAKGPDER